MATVFRTGHEINERVCDALAEGFKDEPIANSYGILRGSGAWAQRLTRVGKRCLMWDKGYFRPGHFDGYYRASWTGTQALVTHRHRLDLGAGHVLSPFNPARWQALGIQIEPWQANRHGHILICPPTPPVAAFFGLENHGVRWADEMGRAIIRQHFNQGPVRVRTKDSPFPLDDDLQGCAAVVTFNSGVGWEALRRGIPVISDVRHSTVGSYLGTTIADLVNDMTHVDRYPLFSFMANRQFTLAEIANGTARRYLL